MDIFAPPDDAHSAWVKDLRQTLTGQEVGIEDCSATAMLSAPVWRVSPDAWGVIAREARRERCRWAGLWLDDLGDGKIRATVVFAKHGGFLVVRTDLDPSAPTLATHARDFPAADRIERGAADLYGVRFEGHPDPRRWLRHQGLGGGPAPVA